VTSAAAGALSITPDMDEDTRARIRREKNRVAARKCRAKKMAFMVELQKTLRELMRKNEEYRLQVGCHVVLLLLFRMSLVCTVMFRNHGERVVRCR
jgi:hypothetical protein